MIENNSQVKEVFDIINSVGLNTDTFCFCPYTNLDYDQSGEIHTCFEGKESMGNWKTQSALKQLNSEEYRNLRRDQKLGNKEKLHSNCKSCYHKESHNVLSYRIRTLLQFYNRYGQETFKEQLLKIKASPEDQHNFDMLEWSQIRLSNYCNLKCMHCDHLSSTQWLNFFTKKENIDKAQQSGRNVSDLQVDNLQKFYEHYRNSSSDYLQDAIKTLSMSKTISFSGGEPLLDPNFLPIMEMFKDYDMSEKTLSIHTNLNVKNINSYVPLWQKFKKLEFYVSIDCPPSTYSYFRKNGDWNLVKHNIEDIQKKFNSNDCKIFGHITFSLFGALRWQEIFDVWHDNNLLTNSSLITEGPTSAKLLPDILKQQVIDTMNEISLNSKIDKSFLVHNNRCLEYLKNTDKIGNRLSLDTENWCRFMDETSNTKTLDFYPELEMYYNSNND